ncbi:hypothetical protein L1049_028371 [Liquidambar formosana]|uniref:Transmembrane protein n=1 Tax=Liquidambar formosana TaxID=63359 RepID=A0AAP0RK51_LIQFO
MAEDEVSEGIKEWEQIQSLKEWSMVVIRDSLSDDCSVFPPINHEGLHISSRHNHQNPECPSPSPSLPSLPSPSPSPSDETGEDPQSSSPSNYRIRLPVDVSRWFAIGLEVLRSKFLGIVPSFRYNAAIGGSVWSFAPVAGLVTSLLLSLLYMRVRRRRHRRCLEQSRDHLLLLIKERDEVRLIVLLQMFVKMPVLI